MEEVTRACAEGDTPDPARWGVAAGPVRPAVEKPTPAGSEVFSSADLTHDLIGTGHQYQVPGTDKHLWIFAATAEDFEMMLSWSLQPEMAAADPDERNRRVLAQAKLGQDLKVAQVILCTRQGPSRGDKRCFTIQDRPAIRGRLGNSTVQEICRISDELSGNEEVLGASARRFFAAFLTCLRTSPFPVDTSDASQTGWNDTRTRLLSLGMAALKRGTLDSGLMSSLADAEGLL
jgi:hypothetical protein